MTAGDTISLILAELKHQEETTRRPNWSDNLTTKVCDANMLGDKALELAFRNKPEEEIKDACIRAAACYIRILKEMK